MSAWQDLVTASLIGTERAMVPATPIPGWPAGHALAGDPASALLDQAALLTAARRAGRLADHAEPLAAAGPDPRRAVSPVAAERLARILSGDHPDLLPEWLRAAVARGKRVPAQALPALLDLGRRAARPDPGLRRLVAAAGGARASWLAGLNPDWKWLAALSLDSTFSATDDARAGAEAWRLGDLGQRRGYLTALRARDPGAARDLTTAGWPAAGASERVMLLSVLADEAGLVPDDEPLLEAALDDRADDVHSWAAYLLATLPGSALGRRMAGRAVGCLQARRGPQGGYLVVRPPGDDDPALRRDGVMPGPATGRSPLADRTRLMLEVLARTPLRTWTDAFTMTPSAIVALRSGDWAPVLFTGWSRAAIAQRDQEWMAALIKAALSGRPPGTPAENEALSRLARRADPALGGPDGVTGPEQGVPAAIRNAITVLRFRYDMLKELDDDHSGG